MFGRYGEVETVRCLLSANKVIAALLFVFVTCSGNDITLAAVHDYCTAYAAEAAYRKTGTDNATVITRDRPDTKPKEVASGTAIGAFDRKWQQAYASTFASCMAKYTFEDMIETASTGPAAKEAEPPLEVRPKPKAEPRTEYQRANRKHGKVPQTKSSISKKPVAERPPLKTNITAKPNSYMSKH